MTQDGSLLILLLTILIQIFFGLALESRSLVRASWCFAIQAVFLVLVFITYGAYVANPWLFVWAAAAAVLSVFLLPFLPGGLLYSARRMPEEARVSPVGTILYVVLALLGILVLGSYTSFALEVDNPMVGLRHQVSINLVAALSLFGYGVIALLTHRHPFKMVLGLMMMTEGAHLTLVHLVPDLADVVKIGVLTQVIPSIFTVLYVNRLIAERLKVTDTAQLSELKY
jgi:hydrogenase-4 membrane subunit HyfE